MSLLNIFSSDPREKAKRLRSDEILQAYQKGVKKGETTLLRLQHTEAILRNPRFYLGEASERRFFLDSARQYVRRGQKINNWLNALEQEAQRRGLPLVFPNRPGWDRHQWDEKTLLAS